MDGWTVRRADEWHKLCRVSVCWSEGQGLKGGGGGRAGATQVNIRAGMKTEMRGLVVQVKCQS